MTHSDNQLGARKQTKRGWDPRWPVQSCAWPLLKMKLWLPVNWINMQSCEEELAQKPWDHCEVLEQQQEWQNKSHEQVAGGRTERGKGGLVGKEISKVFSNKPQRLLLQVLIKQEIQRKSGYAIQADEEQLRVQLDIIQCELNAPTQFRVSSWKIFAQNFTANPVLFLCKSSFPNRACAFTVGSL